MLLTFDKLVSGSPLEDKAFLRRHQTLATWGPVSLAKMTLSLLHTLHLAVFHEAFGQLYMSLADRTVLKRNTCCLIKLLAYCGQVIQLLLKYCIYCASVPSLHRESTASLIYTYKCLTSQCWTHLRSSQLFDAYN